jgi:hypothetical protein
MKKLYKFDIQSKKVSLINTGFANACNNDHGISPDRENACDNFDKLDSENKTYKSSIYTLPIIGTPKLITKNSPSYWHGWSQMARHWHIMQNEMGILIFAQYPLMEGEKKKIDNI